MQKQTISYDVETTGLRRWSADMFSYSVGYEDGRTSVHRLDGSAVRHTQNSIKLRDFWGEKGKRFVKTGHNIKFDLGFTEKFIGESLEGHEIHDTMLMSHVLQNHHHGHALKDLTWELAGYPKDDEKAVSKYKSIGYQHAPEALMDKYQHADAERSMLLYLFFWPKIQANKKWLECYNYERDLLHPTLRMENRGLQLNVPRTKKIIDDINGRISQALEEIEHATGEKTYPGKDSFRHMLFSKNRMALPVYETTEKTKQPKVTKEVLMRLKTEFPQHEKLLDAGLRHISYSSGASMLASYLDLMDEDGVLHPNISTCRAITGREASSDPNLQNIERDDKKDNPYPTPARLCFRPRPGYVNFYLDYAGQEARILIHYSGDVELIKIANTPGGDLHHPAAEVFYESEYTNCTDPKKKKALRNAAKNANFAIAYGAQFAKVAKVLNIPPQSASRVWANYKKRFPKLVGFMPETVRQVKAHGYIETAFGRHLHVPSDQAYMGPNYVGQGTGAEIIKRAQVRVDRYLRQATSDEMRLLLPVHDELQIECPRSRLKEAKPILREVARMMVDFPGVFRLPFEVEVKVATTDWAHKEDYSLN